MPMNELVEANMVDKKIYILVNSDEPIRSKLMSALRAKFEDIYKTVVKIEAREKVPVRGHPKMEQIPFGVLLQAERKGQTTILMMAGGGVVDMSVRELLNEFSAEFDRHNPPDIRVDLCLKLSVTRPLQPPTQSHAPSVETNPQPKFVAAIKNVLALPKPIGRFVFDVVGRHDIADSSSIIFGWIMVLITVLLFRGLIPLEVLINWLVSLGNSFFR